MDFIKKSKTNLQLREQSWIFTKFPFNVALWGVTTTICGEGMNIWETTTQMDNG